MRVRARVRAWYNCRPICQLQHVPAMEDSHVC